MEFPSSRRRSSPGSFRKRSGKRWSDLDNVLKKDSFSDTDTEELRINYQDEMVLVMLNSMLDIIVKEWKAIPSDIGPVCICKQPTQGEIKEESIGSFDLVEYLSHDSKLSIKRDSSGSSKSCKSARKESIKRKLSKISENSKSSIQLISDYSKSSIKKGGKVSRESGESKTGFYVAEWILFPQNEYVKITFKNGNQYEGPTFKKLMHGYGKFTWTDGTVYEGDFEYGFATGHGILRYPDLTTYHGEFCKSILHGYGELNISSTAMTYCGNWKNSEKHGKGWMLYEPEDWYDGEWFEDQRHGNGKRNYRTGEKYQGDWCNGLQHGDGIFVWTNNDVYAGKWKKGNMHGYGEYTWNAFLNQTFTFPTQNIYKGNWVNGARHGLGILEFGFESGAKVASMFNNNQKHGPGILVCGNGSIIQQSTLFLNDNLVNPDDISTANMTTAANTAKTSNVDELPNSGNDSDSQNQSDSSHKSFLRYKMVGNKSLDTTHKSTQCSINSSCLTISRMAIHTPPEDTDFSYYVDLAVHKYTTLLFKDQLAAVELEHKPSQMHGVHSTPKEHKHNPPTESLNPHPMDHHSLLAMLQIQQQEIEKKHLKDTIITHLKHLHKLYDKYAAITSNEKVTFKPILIRYFLWQFVRDLQFFGTTNSLIEINHIISENPNSGFEFVHFPFEKIYFWQFLQMLVCLTWNFHFPSAVTEECKTYGVLATLFVHFLTNVVYPYSRITKSYSIFEFRDLLPINSVYELYKGIGEPHTARKLLNIICVKKHENPPCYLNAWEEQTIKIRPKGINIVPVGGNVIYLEDDTLRIGEPPLPNDNVDSTDPFKTQLFALRSIGPRRVIKCLTSVCPHIKLNGAIVNMEYPLAFIEFYDTILMCTFMLVDRNKRRLERIRMQQDVKVQVSMKELDVETCSSKHRRSSTKVKKPDLTSMILLNMNKPKMPNFWFIHVHKTPSLMPSTCI